MSMLLWRSLAAVLSSLVLRFAVALSYAAGFNAMLFLPLYQARAQSPAPIPIDAGKNAPALTVEGVTSPARQAGRRVRNIIRIEIMPLRCAW